MAQTDPQVSESNPCGKLVKWIKTLGFIKFWKCIPIKKTPCIWNKKLKDGILETKITCLIDPFTVTVSNNNPTLIVSNPYEERRIAGKLY